MTNAELHPSEKNNSQIEKNRFQVLFEHTRQAAAFFSRTDGQIQAHNQAFLRLSGYSEKELQNKRLKNFIHPDEKRVINERLKKMVRAQEKDDVFEVRVINKSGDVFFVEVTVLPYYQKRHLAGVEVFIQDISERKNYEKALLRQNKELKVLNAVALEISRTLSLEQILENSLSIILRTLEFQTGTFAIYDDTLRNFSHIIRCGDFPPELNQFIENELNSLLKNPENISQSVMVFHSMTPATGKPDGMGAALERCGFKSGALVLLRSKRKLRGVLMLWKRDDADFDRSDIMLLMSIGSQVGMAIENSWLYEQTDQKLQARIKELAALNAVANAVSQAIDLEQRLKLALRNILQVLQIQQGGIYIVDEQSKSAYLKANQNLPGIFGEQLENPQKIDLFASNLEDQSVVIDSLGTPIWRRIYQISTLPPDVPGVITLPLCTKKKFLGFACLIVPRKRNLSAEELRLLESIGAQLSVAIENSKLYEEAQARRSELLEINKELENFIYLISHDLKTPVISIQGLIDIFLDELKTPLREIELKYFKAIQDCAERMESLIKALLEFSRLGQTPLTLAKMDLNRTLQEIVTEMDFEREKFSVKIEWTNNFPTVYADRFRLKMAFANLIDNGIKYSRPEADAFVKVTFEEFGDYWQFCVADNGSGIDKKYFQRIFNLFERLTRKPVGSGLGLSMVQRIIKKHGGTIWIESMVGKGSRFYFTLPKQNLAKNGNHAE